MIAKTSNTSERLRIIMEERQLKQTDILELCKPISDKTGVKMSKSTLSQYLSGRNLPKQDKLTLLAQALNVDESWLMGYDSLKKESPEKISDILSNPEAIEIALMFSKLNKNNKDFAKSTIEMLIKKQEDAY